MVGTLNLVGRARNASPTRSRRATAAPAARWPRRTDFYLVEVIYESGSTQIS